MTNKSASILTGVIGIGAIAGCLRLADFARHNYYMAEQHGQAIGWQMPAQAVASVSALALGVVLLYASYRIARGQ